MSDKEALNKMLDNLISNKGEQAEVHFHDYLQGKMQEVIHGDEEVAEVPDNTTDNEEQNNG
jgi:hypothetical protein